MRKNISLVCALLVSLAFCLLVLHEPQSLRGVKTRFAPPPTQSLSKVKSPQSPKTAPEWVTIGEEDFGVWLERIEWSKSAPKQFACGVDIRVESPQGNADDTAMNGLYFRTCDEDNWYRQDNYKVEGGQWGSWYNKIMCPVDGYIVGLQLRIEKKVRAVDNTALNGLKFRCSNSNWIVAHEGYWGDWRPAVNFGNRLICGGRSKWLAYQGGGWNPYDDVAMSGLQVQLCPVAPESLGVWEVLSMDLDQNNAKSVTINVIQREQSNSNHLSTSQQSEFTFQIDQETKSVITTQDQLMIGANLEISVENSVGIENVASSKWGVKVGLQTQWTRSWIVGEEKSVKFSESYKEQLVTAPCSVGVLSLTVEIKEVSIPFKTRMRNKQTGEITTSTGTFKTRGLGPARSSRTTRGPKLC